MKQILYMALKDLRLLARNKGSMFSVFVFPLMMALFFGSIFSSGEGETAKMKIATISDNHSETATAFYDNLKSLDALNVVTMPLDSAREMVRQGKLVAYVSLQTETNDESNFFATGLPPVKIGIDPSRKAEAGYLEGMVTQALFSMLQKQMTDPEQLRGSIPKWINSLDTATALPDQQRDKIKTFLSALLEFNDEMSADDSATVSSASSPFASVTIDTEQITRKSEQPQSAWEITFPQSLLWAIIGIVASFAVSIVSERIRGTFVRLQLAPVKRIQILAGKASACFIASVIMSLILMSIGVVIFGVRIGNPLGLLIAIFSTAACFSGIMMLISVIGKTEQAVGGAGWGVMLMMSMIGGGMIPLMILPAWMLKVSNFSPVKWGIYSLEGAIWRGFSFTEMALPVAILLSIGLASFSLGAIILAKNDK